MDLLHSKGKEKFVVDLNSPAVDYWKAGKCFAVQAQEPDYFKMYGPPSLCLILDELPKRKDGTWVATMSCKDAKQTVQVPLRQDHPGGMYYFGHPWQDFAYKVGILKGDLVLFTYCGCLEFQVSVLESTYSDESGIKCYETREYDYMGCPMSVVQSDDEVRYLTLPPVPHTCAPFQRTMAMASREKVCIAKPFAECCSLDRREGLRIRIPDTFTTVRVQLTYSKTTGYRFGKGWSAVYDLLKLNVGDRCQFSLDADYSTRKILCIDVLKLPPLPK